MLIDTASIKWCLSKSAEIHEIYKLNYLNSDSSIRSVNNLLDLCRKFLNKNIELFIHEDSHLSHGVKGFLVTTGDGYQICLLDEQNNCWKRFVLCKELFHVILDEERFRNVSLIDHIEDFTAGLIDKDHHSCDSAQSEILAEISAMEFLFPYSDRKVLLNNAEQVHFMDIAERYKIPRFYVERYLSDRMMEALDPDRLAEIE